MPCSSVQKWLIPQLSALYLLQYAKRSSAHAVIMINKEPITALKEVALRNFGSYQIIRL
jgi:hypothetical protein